MNAPIIDFTTGQPIRPGFLEYIAAHAHAALEEERRQRISYDDGLLRVMSGGARITTRCLVEIDGLARKIALIEAQIDLLADRIARFEAGGGQG